MGLRARHLTSHLPSSFQVEILYREAGKLTEFRRFCRKISECPPDLIYVMNVGYVGGGAALLAKGLYGIPFVLDHGDPSYELLRSSGRPLWESVLVWFAEWIMLETAAAVVARGASLTESLRSVRPEGVYFLPDGVDTERFRVLDVTDLRCELGLDDALVIGVIGSIVWSNRYSMCYGWDIIETINRLKHRPVKGLIVGDGTGLPYLKERAKQYGIEDRICFTGRVPHEDVPQYINLMDVCLSTQTNDSVGHGRTTAKLPEYLACGRFIIATDVGGAREVVAENGFLLPYVGVYDPKHPDRLAERVEWLLDHPDALKDGLQGVGIAKREFEYQQLAHRLGVLFDWVKPSSSPVEFPRRFT